MKLNNITKILIGVIIILIIAIVFLTSQTQNQNPDNATKSAVDTTRPVDNIANDKTAKLNSDFEKYNYALDRMVEARKISSGRLQEIYDKIDPENNSNTLEDTAIYADSLISQYQEINDKYRLAKNKLDTIKDSEIENAIFDLTQALIFYTEIYEETIKFYRHIENEYLNEVKDDYQKGSAPEVNTAFFIMKNSFNKIDNYILGDTDNHLNNEYINRYKKSKQIILHVE